MQELKAIAEADRDYVAEGAPERETIISHDEITNLVIALNTTNSVDEFLAYV